MSKNLKENLEFLNFILHTTRKIKHSILENASDSLVLAICEICFNLCKDKIKCGKKIIKKLSPIRKFIHILAQTKRGSKNFQKQKRVLKKNGEKILNLILPLFFTGTE
jgi:hypothetical protein